VSRGKTKALDPSTEECDTCGAAIGAVCDQPDGCGFGFHFCDERWRRAAETRECLEEDRLERQRDVLADMKVCLGGPV
jgi:hypothetical protein